MPSEIPLASPSDGAGAAVPTRRRGEALEHALLDACWQELLAVGYRALTMEAVAKRAGTSKTVVYRRWPTLAELVLAALVHQVPVTSSMLPDTGSLRGDLREMLICSSRRLDDARVAALGLLADFQHDEALFGRVRDEIFGGMVADIMRTLVARAAERGEIPTAELPQRTLTAPIDLARHELLINARPLSLATIESIIDDVAVPLLRNGR